MSDLTKKSGIFYLAFFLLAVCAVATGVMAAAAYVTKEPIEANMMKKTLAGLQTVLDGMDYDNDPAADSVILKADDGSEVTLYTARKGGKVTAYAVKASTMKGYGGKMEGLASFDSSGVLQKYIITSGSETPGIGTKVTERVNKRSVSDVFAGREVPSTLPANATLDSFQGKRYVENEGVWTRESGISFVTGATVSSNAVTDLAWKAAKTLARKIENDNKVTEE